MTKFIPVAVAIVAFSASITSAFAHSEFRDRDGVQGATASYSQVIATQNVAPTVSLSDAESLTIAHNSLKDYNK